MKLSGIKVALWDLDGTLIDSFGVFMAIITEAAELSGLPAPTEQDLHHNFHGSLEQTIRDSMNMVDDAQLETILSDFLDVQEKYYQRPDDHLHADAFTLLLALHETGVQQVIVTNRAHDGRGNASPRNLVKHSKLIGYIDGIICGDEAIARKPDAAVVSNLSLLKGINPDQIIVIGDQVVDAQLAQNLGCRAVLINRNQDEPIPHLDNILGSKDFLTVVPSLEAVSVY